AIKELEKAIKLVTKDPIIAEHLGDAYLKNSKKDRALAMYEKALKLDPDKKLLKEKIKMIKENK
ncbi:MAG: tetratricopeptide repeat protein, partial [bacterium]